MQIKIEGKSTVQALTVLLNSSLPRTINTGITNHLGLIKPENKGKAVKFCWARIWYKVTENLKVTEEGAFGDWIVTNESKKLEEILVTKFGAMGN